MPIWKSKAKNYHLCMRNLVRRCKKLYPTFIKGEIKRNDIDTEGEYMRRVFFKCDGIEYTIRLWSMDDIKNGVEIDFTLFERYYCNDCGEEFERDIDGWTRCEKCASHY